MNKKQLLLSFFVAAASANIWGQITGQFALAAVSKVLIIPALAALTVTEGSPPKKYLLALFFSWLGDSFLILDGVLYFALGIGSFWGAQLLYCTLILKELKGGLFAQFKKKNTLGYGTVFLLYLIGMLAIITPSLQELKIPVTLYAATLCITGFLGLACAIESHSSTAKLLAIGCVLFIVSDSMIAFDAFYFDEKKFGYWIIATYVPAQYFISRHLARR